MITRLITGEGARMFRGNSSHFRRNWITAQLGNHIWKWLAGTLFLLSAVPAMSADWQTAIIPADIAPTAATVDDPAHVPEVQGQPRNAQGHPCTLWDQQDLQRYKSLMASDPQTQALATKLFHDADARLTKPLNVPGTHQGPDGSWVWPGDFPQNEPPNKNPTKNSGVNSEDMTLLATAYALSGDAKYGEYCRKMLLAYADGYNHWGRPKDTRWRYAKDGRLSYQFLNDGFWLLDAAWAYDLVHDLPSWTEQDRTHVRDDLFKSVIAEFITPEKDHTDYLSQYNNRSALCAAGTLLAGYATEDQGLIDWALYGHNGTKEKPTGGMIQTHFGPGGILPDGLWVEGAPAYQMNILGSAVFDAAEILWRHGIDMYRFRNGILKRMLDAGMVLAYPDNRLVEPCLHDSGSFSLLDTRDWANSEFGTVYECGYQRYLDPAYIPIVRNGVKHLGLTIHKGPPSILLPLPASSEAAAVPVQNANFYSVGYGVLRVGDGTHLNSLLLEYGPSAGHAHPSKLSIDQYAFGQGVMPMPGVIFPYSDPLDKSWYWTTISNNALEVDETDQIYFANAYKFKGAPKPEALQLVYAPASTFGMQRAYSDTVQTGVTEDRALFVTPRYTADLYAAFSATPHKYDLAWHVRGKMDQASLPLSPMTFSSPTPAGYSAMSNVQHAMTEGTWTAAFTAADKPLRLVGAGGVATDLIFGDGHFDGHKETPPMMIARRVDQNDTIFGTAIDLSGESQGYIQSVDQKGGPDQGFALLALHTTDGTQLCFSSYRPGDYSAEGLSTNGQQAMAIVSGEEPTAMYLAGGTSLKCKDAILERSEPGLAFVERTADGHYVIGNASPTDSTITITLPALKGMRGTVLNPTGSSGKSTAGGDGAIPLKIPGGGRVEFAPAT
jgi:hypothetical protein